MRLRQVLPSKAHLFPDQTCNATADLQSVQAQVPITGFRLLPITTITTRLPTVHYLPTTEGPITAVHTTAIVTRSA
jgi:hypothetical protein